MNKQIMSMNFAATEQRVMAHMMSTKVINGVPMMSHVQIHKLTGVRQDNIKVVMDGLKKDGVIAFTEIQEMVEIGSGAMRSAKVYYVNERDSHVVVGKISAAYLGFLVDFWMAHREPIAPQFKLPQTFAEAMKLAADLALEKERDAPKVAFVDEVINQSEGLMTLGNYGRVLKTKGLNTGAKKIFNQLRFMGLIMIGRSIPYDRYVNQGLFVVSEKITEFRADPVTYVTAKGQIYVHQKLDELLG